MSKRVLIISDSIFRQTGYSTVANKIIENLDDSYVVAQLGLSHRPVDYAAHKTQIHYYSPLLKHKECCNSDVLFEYYNPDTNKLVHINPINAKHNITDDHCFKGVANASDPYAFESAYYVINHFKADIVIAINDIWGMYKLAYLKNRYKFKLISYLAIDSECFPPMIKNNEENINTLDYISKVDKLIVFTEWAKTTINKTAKIIRNKEFDNIDVINHGVDLNEFNNIADKRTIVKNLFNLDSDTHFIIGSVNRNQPRKRLDAIFQILRILIDKYEKSNGKRFMVHMHCAINDSHGWDLQWLSNYYNVQDRLILDANLKPGIGVSTELLNIIMNSYDVHLVPTNSEGWGLSILETMACGIPNVISDYSAHGDWAKDHALTIKLSAKIHEPITNHIKGIIDIEHAAKQINLLYSNNRVYTSIKNESLKLADKLQWGNVCKHWNKLLLNTDISDLSENRYDTIKFSSNLIMFPSNPLTKEFIIEEV